MTNTEAIKKLDQQKTLLCFDCMHPQTVEWCEEHCQVLEAYNMAINALKAEEQLAKNSSKVDKESGELISRQAEITDEQAIEHLQSSGWMQNHDKQMYEMGAKEQPQPDYQEVLGWLLAYHTQSFYLHGQYLPHEVISWLINDFTKEYIAERRTDSE